MRKLINNVLYDTEKSTVILEVVKLKCKNFISMYEPDYYTYDYYFTLYKGNINGYYFYTREKRNIVSFNIKRNYFTEKEKIIKSEPKPDLISLYPCSNQYAYTLMIDNGLDLPDDINIIAC